MTYIVIYMVIYKVGGGREWVGWGFLPFFSLGSKVHAKTSAGQKNQEKKKPGKYLPFWNGVIS
jgi:hypothetical protein